MDQKSFIQGLQKRGIELNSEQINQFEEYRVFLQQENQKINLTALISDSDIYEKHFYDCSLILPLIEDASSLCDVGSGAGFPGVVLAILKNRLQVTLVEPTQKRCRFLQELVIRLGLNNVTVINKRAEDYQEAFETFDVATARAVANLLILLEIALPLVKVRGKVIAMKGSQGLIEADEAKHALITLKSTLLESQKLYLPDGSERINLVIKKEASLPNKYPRSYSQIKKKPL